MLAGCIRLIDDKVASKDLSETAGSLHHPHIIHAGVAKRFGGYHTRMIAILEPLRRLALRRHASIFHCRALLVVVMVNAINSFIVTYSPEAFDVR
jgi:hypothetical protein